MRTRFVLPSCLGLLLFLAGTAWAAELTPAKVDTFLKSWVELEKISDAMPEEPMDEEDSESEDMTADWTKSIVWDAKMKAVLAKYNYTPEEWSDTAGRVFGVYSTVKYDEAKVEMDKEMAEARAEIENDPNIAPEQKKEILKSLEQTQANFAGIEQHRPSDADMAVVKPFIPQMDEMFEGD